MTALAFGLVMSASPAFAGFQWVAPPDSGASSYAPQSGSGYAPRSAGGPEVISPIVITGDNGPTMETTPSIASTPSANAAASAAPAGGGTHNLTIISAPPDNEIVQGFGNDIPLALALRQILPVGYNFSIDQNIDMETTVSYKGGKPWRDTLNGILIAANLSAREQNKTLTVSKGGTAGLAPVATTTTTQTTTTTTAPVIIDNGPGAQTASTAVRTVSVGAGPRYAENAPALNVGSPDGWSAERGDTLRKVLAQWCKRANVELQWIAEYDYPMEASAHFGGGFEDAVRLLLAGFESARPQPVAELHSNPSAGQMLLVVQTRGNNYAN